jgi:NAD(P) transhydrogenase subunit alpha
MVFLTAARTQRLVFGLGVVLIVCAVIGSTAGYGAPPKAADPAAAEQGSTSPSAEKAAPVTGDDELTESEPAAEPAGEPEQPPLDRWSMLFVFVLATFIGIGVVRRVSRLLHTPLMSLTNAISAIAVVGSIMITGGEEYPLGIRILGAVALFASMTNIVSGFLITDRMLKMFKTPGQGGKGS